MPARRRRLSRAPFTFIVNIMVPSSPPWSLCMSWAAATHPDAVDAHDSADTPSAGGAPALGQALEDAPEGGSGGFSSCSNTSRSNSGLLGAHVGAGVGGGGGTRDPHSMLDSPFDLVLARCGPGGTSRVPKSSCAAGPLARLRFAGRGGALARPAWPSAGLGAASRAVACEVTAPVLVTRGMVAAPRLRCAVAHCAAVTRRSGAAPAGSGVSAHQLFSQAERLMRRPG